MNGLYGLREKDSRDMEMVDPDHSFLESLASKEAVSIKERTGHFCWSLVRDSLFASVKWASRTNTTSLKEGLGGRNKWHFVKLSGGRR